MSYRMNDFDGSRQAAGSRREPGSAVACSSNGVISIIGIAITIPGVVTPGAIGG